MISKENKAAVVKDNARKAGDTFMFVQLTIWDFINKFLLGQLSHLSI